MKPSVIKQAREARPTEHTETEVDPYLKYALAIICAVVITVVFFLLAVVIHYSFTLDWKAEAGFTLVFGSIITLIRVYIIKKLFPKRKKE